MRKIDPTNGLEIFSENTETNEIVYCIDEAVLRNPNSLVPLLNILTDVSARGLKPGIIVRKSAKLDND
ncbi:MAG: hypothetical protein AB7O79_10420 [Xanthobacteraceae bacterium]